MKWYKESHSPKGKSVFLEQMKKFVEWLQNAEEGKFLIVKLILLYIVVYIFTLCCIGLREVYSKINVLFWFVF